MKEYTKAASEAEALELTRGDVKEEGEGLPRRRIGDFTLATPKGIHEPVLSIEAGMGVELILSGAHGHASICFGDIRGGERGIWAANMV